MTVSDSPVPARSWRRSAVGALTALVLVPFVAPDRVRPLPLPPATRGLVALAVLAWSATWFGLGVNDMVKLGMFGAVPFLIALPHGC